MSTSWNFRNNRLRSMSYEGAVNGVDMLKWNDEGKIVEFKVLIRPLKAINLIHQKMAAMLQAQR